MRRLYKAEFNIYIRVIAIEKILFAGFEGCNNSAKILLDKLTPKAQIEKLYLKNDFEKCAFQIINHIKNNKYKFIIAFGQNPVIKSIYIEKYGCIDEQKYKTIFRYDPLKEALAEREYRVKLSDNAGKYLCNYVYGIGLSYIEQQKTKIPYIFIHIPYIKNLSDIDGLASVFDEFTT